MKTSATIALTFAALLSASLAASAQTGQPAVHRVHHHHHYVAARLPAPGRAGRERASSDQQDVQPLCASRRWRQRRAQPRPGRLQQGLHRRQPGLKRSFRSECACRQSARRFRCEESRLRRRRRQLRPEPGVNAHPGNGPGVDQKRIGIAAAGASTVAGRRTRAGADSGRGQKIVLRFPVDPGGQVKIGPRRIAQAGPDRIEIARNRIGVGRHEAGNHDPRRDRRHSAGIVRIARIDGERVDISGVEFELLPLVAAEQLDAAGVLGRRADDGIGL